MSTLAQDLQNRGIRLEDPLEVHKEQLKKTTPEEATKPKEEEEEEEDYEPDDEEDNDEDLENDIDNDELYGLEEDKVNVNSFYRISL